MKDLKIKPHIFFCKESKKWKIELDRDSLKFDPQYSINCFDAFNVAELLNKSKVL